MLKPLACLTLVLIAITASACRSNEQPPALTPTPEFTWPATFTPASSAIIEVTATRVIPAATSPTAPPTPVLPTAVKLTPIPQPPASITARPSPTPEPTLLPLTRVAAAAALRATVIAQSSPTPRVAGTLTEAPLDSYQLIERGWQRGEIDIDHAAVFRLYSLLGGGRTKVPPQYLSDVLINGDGLGLYMYAMKDWFDLSPATQAALGGYVTPREITRAELSVTPTTTPFVRLPGGSIASTIAPKEDVGSVLPMTGQWTFDLTSGAVTLNGMRVITRSVYQRDRQVVFVDEYGSYACVEVGQEGIYTWADDGKALTFTKVGDPCAARSQLLTAHAWVKE